MKLTDLLDKPIQPYDNTPTSGSTNPVTSQGIKDFVEDDFVPYTGATQDVDLGENGISGGFFKFDTTPTDIPEEQGAMFWDEDDNTVDVILNGYRMKIGEDLFYPVKNQTGTSIPKGTNVRFAGTVGSSGRLLIAPFIANNTVASTFYMGVTAETIGNGEDGKVLWFGRIRGINTNAFNEGDVLYASTTVAGGFQTTVPTAPNNIVQVAAVINKSTTQGVIFTRPQIEPVLYTPENVANKVTDFTSPSDITYPTSLAVNTKLGQKEDSLGFTPENVANKATNLTSPDNTKYPTTQAVVDGLGTKFTLPALTSGSVLFSNGSTIAQDNSQLFWDNTNKRLGIGTNVPTNPLTIGVAPANSLQNSAATFLSSKVNSSNVFNLIVASSVNQSDRGVFQGVRSRGTLSAPLAVLANDAITTFLSGAFDGTSTQFSAAISFDAESNASAGNAPQKITFVTGTTGANRAQRMEIRSNGNVGIGTTTTGARLDVRAQGALSTDIAFRVRNSADSANLVEVNGLGTVITGGSSSGANNALSIRNSSNSIAFEVTNSSLTKVHFDLQLGNTVVYWNGGNQIRNTANGVLRICDSTGNNFTRIQLGNTTASFPAIERSGASICIMDATGASGASLSVGTTTVNASAKVQIDSTTQGFLPPRMTNAQRLAIASPAVGLIVYCTDAVEGLYENTSTGWVNLNSNKPLQVTPITLSAASWTLVSGLYEYDYSNANITSASIVDVIPSNSTIAIVQAAGFLPSTLSTSGSVKLYANNLPTADIVVTFNIFN